MFELNTLTEEDIREILHVYQLDLQFYERIKTVYKVYTNLGVFVLKRMNHKENYQFFHHYNQLLQKGYRRIVPIFSTNDGRQAVLYKENYYYLMPWFDGDHQIEKQKNQIKTLRELARLHSISSHTVELTESELEEHYQQVNNKWLREKELLEKYMDQSESVMYMSPFQLYFCMVFHEVEGALQFALNQLHAWYEQIKEEPKVRSVLVHGKISPDHFIYNADGYGFFTSLENMQIASPIYDLIIFISENSHLHPEQFHQTIESLEQYLYYFPLTNNETTLFLGYLAFPHHFISIVESYYVNKQPYEEYKYVNKLIKSYNEMKNAEKIIIYFENKKQTPLDDES